MDAVWSIGVYTGDTLFDLKPAVNVENPVITAGAVGDIDAEFVADPFMIRVGRTWHMFFEVMNAQTNRGEIGLAISDDGFVWRYARIVLSRPFHLSYPYVFCLDNEYYMVPESHRADSTSLYRADPFPEKWSLVGSIMKGAWVDSSIVFFGGMWWMFATPALSRSSRLDLFYSESISGPWRAHPMNAIVADNNRIARPGGRVIVLGDKLIRFTQDCHPFYGTQVRAFEISELTESSYREREVGSTPILSGGGSDWNRFGMHHVDPHWADGRWLACVDGWRCEMPSHN